MATPTGVRLDADAVNAAIAATGETKVAIAARMGIGTIHLSRIIHGHRGCSLGVLDRLAATLGVPAVTLMTASEVEAWRSRLTIPA